MMLMLDFGFCCSLALALALRAVAWAGIGLESFLCLLSAGFGGDMICMSRVLVLHWC